MSVKKLRVPIGRTVSAVTCSAYHSRRELQPEPDRRQPMGAWLMILAYTWHALR